MGYTEFYCDPVSGANVNAGSDAGTPSMSDTAGTGSWNSATGVYVSVATTGAAAIGQWLSVYAAGATQTGFSARILNVSGGGGSPWTITVSLTAIAGAIPTTGAAFSAKVGGAFAGPAGAVLVPVNLITAVSVNLAGDPPRVNYKNTGNYTPTVTLAHKNLVTYQGYTGFPGDFGRATFQGALAGASYQCVSGSNFFMRDLNWINNGNSGSSGGLGLSVAIVLERCSVSQMMGYGIAFSNYSAGIDCEAHHCNLANSTGIKGGITLTVASTCIRCFSHHHTGSNCNGFYSAQSGVGPLVLIGCLAVANGQYGYLGDTGSNIEASLYFEGCVFDSNGVDNLRVASTGADTTVFIENCIFSNAGTGYGVNVLGTFTGVVRLNNSAFFNNFAGATTGINTGFAIGSITLTGNPFTAPATGDFSLNSTAGAGAACRAAGRGGFVSTYASYTTPTVSYPDVGAAQHADASLADSVWDQTNGVDVGMTPRQAMKLILAAVAGKSSVAAGVWTYRDSSDSINRIVCTVDLSNQRTAITYDVT